MSVDIPPKGRLAFQDVCKQGGCIYSNFERFYFEFFHIADFTHYILQFYSFYI